MTVQELQNKIINSRRTLFILCGLPYAGKTYISKTILSNASCVFVSIDQILERRGYDWNTNKLPTADGWNEVFEESYQLTREALDHDKNVLYDSTNHTRISRDVLRNVALALSAPSFVVYIKASPALVHERWAANRLNKKRFVLASELLEATIKAFEPPSPDENVLTIDNSG